MTESSLFAFIAAFLGLGIGGVIWLVISMLAAVKSLANASDSLTASAMKLNDTVLVLKEGANVLLAEMKLAHETLGVVTQHVSEMMAKSNKEMRAPRPWHHRPEQTNGAAPEEDAELEREWNNDWAQG